MTIYIPTANDEYNPKYPYNTDQKTCDQLHPQRYQRMMVNWLVSYCVVCEGLVEVKGKKIKLDPVPVRELVDLGELESKPYKYTQYPNIKKHTHGGPYTSGKKQYAAAGSTTNDPRIDI